MILRRTVLIFFSFVLAIFILPSTIYADWIKHELNPVIAPSADGWDWQAVRSPSVIYDDGGFKLYYQGRSANSEWQIGVAYSKDGITWTKNQSNPIITPSNSQYMNEAGLEEPSVLKDSLYRMWYKSDPTSTIRYATSTDGVVWERYEKAVLIGSGSWENQGVANPSVIYKDGKYWMYYTGWGVNSGWLIGLATSTDGINWTKYAKNPLSLPIGNHAGRPAVIYKDGQFHMYYHTGYGRGTDIYHAVSTDGINFSCPEDCSIIKRGPTGSFDSYIIIGPGVIEHNSQIYLYYAGTKEGNIWQIGLASAEPIIIGDKKIPIVLIPGLFASWNKEALIHNQIVSQEQWLLNPIVHQYDGILKSLNNLGYQNNQDYYLFNYDWRKGLDNLADYLKIYLDQKIYPFHQNENISLVGHSLGGLIGRIYLQKYNDSKVNNLITVGSPHLGVAQSYKAIEAGELDTENSLLWLAQKLILQLNKDELKTDRQIVSEKLPVIQDILPIYNFLKNTSGQEITAGNMQIKNNTLISYAPTFPNIFSKLQSIYGEKGDTLEGFKVSPRSTFDTLLDLYPDGRPMESLFSAGDLTVTSKSGNAGDNGIKMSDLDHGEIVYKKDGIKKIFDSLSINYQENQVTEGAPTEIFPSLIFLILSPATIEVEYNGQTFVENQGMIYIPNYNSGDYLLKVKGQSLGRYSILIGELAGGNDNWTRIEGEIKTLPQTDSYSIQDNTLSSENLFDELILYLIDLNKTLKKSEINKAISNLNMAKKYFNQKNITKLKLTLLLVHKQLFQVRPNQLYAIEKLEKLYGQSLADYRIGVVPAFLKIDLTIKKNIIPIIQKFLLAQKNKGKNTTNNSLILLIIEGKLKLAEENLKNKNYSFVEIYLRSIDELLKEVKKI